MLNGVCCGRAAARMIEVSLFPFKRVQRAYERLTLPRAIINVVLIIFDKLPEIVTYFTYHMVHNDDNRMPVEGGSYAAV